MNISIMLFLASGFRPEFPVIALERGSVLEYKEVLFQDLLTALRTFEKSEKRKYPPKKRRLKRKNLAGKKWVLRRNPKAFAEKALFLIDHIGNRIPLIPTKNYPEKHLLMSSSDIRRRLQKHGSESPLLKALLDTLPIREGKVVLRFSGKIP